MHQDEKHSKMTLTEQLNLVLNVSATTMSLKGYTSLLIQHSMNP